MACLTRYEDRLARALGSVINILDPDVIVARRRGCRISIVCTEAVPARWAPYIFSTA